MANSTQPADYLVNTYSIVEGGCILVGNSLIAVTLLGHQSMQKNQMKTAVALAIADGLYGVGVTIGSIRRVAVLFDPTTVLLSAWECMLKPPTIFYIAGSQMTSLTMVMISVDRYLAVTHGAWYLAHNDKRHTYGVAFSVIAFGVATSALAVTSSYFGWGDGSTHEAKWPALCLSTWAVPKWYATGYTVFVAAGGYISIGIYAAVLRAYRQYARKTNAESAYSNLAEIKMKRERRVTITMAFVTLMTLLFHSIPYTVIILTTVLKMNVRLSALVKWFVWRLVGINSMANIFVYLKRHPDIRSAVRDVVHGRLKPIGGQSNNNDPSIPLRTRRVAPAKH